jgi:hypothetical protein
LVQGPDAVIVGGTMTRTPAIAFAIAYYNTPLLD